MLAIITVLIYSNYIAMRVYPIIPWPAHAGISGFESPAAEYTQLGLRLDELLVLHPSATRLCIAQGDAMKGVGIFDGDLLIIDRHIKPQTGSVIYGQLNGEFICKIYDEKRRMLLTSDEKCQAITIHDYDDFCVEGVVIRTLRQHLYLNDFIHLTADYSELRTSLDDLLVLHPCATWFGVAQGDSMRDEGIYDGDVLIIDRQVNASQGAVIVAQLNGEFICKIFDKKRRILLSANPQYHAVPIRDCDSFSVEGVVIRSIRMHFQSSLLGLWSCTP
ncbi:putative prophage repressor [Shewanella sp. MR-4]|nr:putative prophage repressor [Shewanella sp. MR-4]